jgi:hypothetical protein
MITICNPKTRKQMDLAKEPYDFAVVLQGVETVTPPRSGYL